MRVRVFSKGSLTYAASCRLKMKDPLRIKTVFSWLLQLASLDRDDSSGMPTTDFFGYNTTIGCSRLE